MPLLTAADSEIRGQDIRSLFDRIDTHIDVPAVKFRELTGDAPPETDSSTTLLEQLRRNTTVNYSTRQVCKSGGKWYAYEGFPAYWERTRLACK
jgi:hypothetical protein